MSKVATHSPEQTRAAGAALADAILLASSTKPIVIALNGDLGAGKTTLVSGLLCALGVTGAVRSPTYTLVEPYEFGARTIYHLDLYRLTDPRELEMLALRDLLVPGSVLLVEWAERGASALPKADLSVMLEYSSDKADTKRLVRLEWASEVGKELAMRLQRSVNKQNVSP